MDKVKIASDLLRLAKGLVGRSRMALNSWSEFNMVGGKSSRVSGGLATYVETLSSGFEHKSDVDAAFSAAEEKAKSFGDSMSRMLSDQFGEAFTFDIEPEDKWEVGVDKGRFVVDIEVVFLSKVIASDFDAVFEFVAKNYPKAMRD